MCNIFLTDSCVGPAKEWQGVCGGPTTSFTTLPDPLLCQCSSSTKVREKNNFHDFCGLTRLSLKMNYYCQVLSFSFRFSGHFVDVIRNIWFFNMLGRYYNPEE